jgi:hypothetical protein
MLAVQACPAPINTIKNTAMGAMASQLLEDAVASMRSQGRHVGG